MSDWVLLGSMLLSFWYGFLVGFCNGRRVLLRFRWPFQFKARKGGPRVSETLCEGDCATDRSNGSPVTTEGQPCEESGGCGSLLDSFISRLMSSLRERGIGTKGAKGERISKEFALRLLATIEALQAENATLRAAGKWNVFAAFADCHPDFPAFKEGWDRVPEDKAWKPEEALHGRE